jgi:uncharacterized integral membrane protein
MRCQDPEQYPQNTTRRERIRAVPYVVGYIPPTNGYKPAMTVNPPSGPGSFPTEPDLTGGAAPPVGDRPAGDGPTGDRVVRSTRTGRTWTAAVSFAFVLILLLVFILQNGQSVKISFIGLNGHLPLAVAMLFAAAAGALLVAIPGVGRMVQLRRAARRR